MDKIVRRSLPKIMQVVEIEDGLAVRINEAAKSENKSLTEFVNSILRERLSANESRRTDEEKVRKFIASYEQNPQTPEEYEVWESEQVWSKS